MASENGGRTDTNQTATLLTRMTSGTKAACLAVSSVLWQAPQRLL
jgi:hypothetical protein